jgi:O-antigen ligase
MEVIASNPVLGVGARGFEFAIEDLGSRPRVAHNTALSLGAELGLVGLVLFGVALWFVWRPLGGLPRSPRWAARSLFAAWFLGALTLTWEHAKVSWFVMSLLVAAGQVVQEE